MLRIFFILTLIAFTTSMEGQVRLPASSKTSQPYFASHKLELLFRQLSKHKATTPVDTLIEMGGEVYTQRRLAITINHCRVPVIIEANSGIVEHIGVKIFPRFSDFPQIFLYRAVERILLELMLNSNQAINLLETERITILLDDVPFGSLDNSRIEQVLEIMLSAEKFPYSWNNYRYLLECEFNGHRLEWILPAREELIKGYDKRELDRQLIQQLTGDCSAIIESNVQETDLRQLENGLWLLPGNEFFSGISSRCYYRKTNADPELVFDEQYPIESIMNFLQKEVRPAPSLRLNLKYKNTPDTTIAIDYRQLRRELEKEHLIYAGIETEQVDAFQVVVVFENRIYNHLHLLSFWLPRAVLSGTAPVIEAQFYPNIRRDNINDLFSIETFDNKVQKFQIRLQ
jgi:hypothetical protein